jgi:hypothetical protein
MNDSILAVLILIFLLALPVLYFWPIVVAVRTNHKNTASIAVVNVCLGWTLVGWVVAMAWALKKD